MIKSWVWWYKSVFSAIEKWRQEDHGHPEFYSHFENSLGYMTLQLKKKEKKKKRKLVLIKK